MRRGVSLLAITVVLAAACSSGGGSGVTAGTTAAPDTANGNGTNATNGNNANNDSGNNANNTGNTGTAKKQGIGQVIDIIPVGGTVGGAAAFAGQAVAAQDLIASDPNG